MATMICDLPPEVVTYLLKFLTPKEIVSFSQVCRTFHEASKVDGVWQTLCREDFGIDKITSELNITFQDLYAKVLHRYGNTLGLWRPDIGPYGGLIHVKFDKDHLVGVHYGAPVSPYISRALRSQVLFSIRINEINDTEVLCHQGHGGPHPCQITSSSPDTFCFACYDSERHKHPGGKQAEFAKWLLEETSSNDEVVFHGHDRMLMKFLMLQQHQNGYSMTRIVQQSVQEDVVVQPGIFKGLYGAHGIEILMLTYNEDRTQLLARKITGDPNVPAGEITFKVDLSRPMVLTLSQQDTLENLAEIDTADLPPGTKPNQLPSQPFKIPRDCYDREGPEDIPNRCQARFHAMGQIAHHGFNHPSFIPSHWVVFDNDNFGNMWMELKSFSMFTRIAEVFD